MIVRMDGGRKVTLPHDAFAKSYRRTKGQIHRDTPARPLQDEKGADQVAEALSHVDLCLITTTTVLIVEPTKASRWQWDETGAHSVRLDKSG